MTGHLLHFPHSNTWIAILIVLVFIVSCCRNRHLLFAVKTLHSDLFQIKKKTLLSDILFSILSLTS